MLIIYKNTREDSHGSKTTSTIMIDSTRITWVTFCEYSGPTIPNGPRIYIGLLSEPSDDSFEASGDLARDLKALLIENCHPSNLGAVHVRNADGAMGGVPSVNLGRYVDGRRERANVESAAAEPEATAEPWAVYIISHALGVQAIAAKLHNDYTDGRVLWYQCHGPLARANAESEASRINSDPVVLEDVRKAARL